MYAPVVDRSIRLTPSLVRIILTGPDLTAFPMPDATDTYINLAFAPADAPYGTVFDPKQVREDYPRELQPARRRYTIRSWDPAKLELAVDFVTHGTEGVAGPWADTAQPGEVLIFEGPASGYRPRPDAEWYLMIGDESALPAIAASAEVLPAGKPLQALLLCDGPADELPIDTDADLDLRWLHRNGSGTELVDELRTVDFPSTDVCAFVHGEAQEIRAIRKHLLSERELTRQNMSCSPYWRRTMSDEDWRQVKRDFVAAMDADVA